MKAYYLFLTVAGAAMLCLGLLDVPTLNDDMLYRFQWTRDPSAPVETIDGVADLLRSQWNHYQLVNGRFVPHLLAQAFLVFAPWWLLPSADALLFVLLVHLCVRRVAPDGRQQLFVAVAVVFLLFIVFSGFRSAMLWGLGTFNYLWVLVAVMMVLTCVERSDLPRRWLPALCPLLLLAGWTHEALSVPVSAAFALCLFVRRRQLRHSPVPLLMLSFMVGAALCLTSPGIWNRSTEGGTMQARLMSAAINCVSNVRVLWLLLLTLAVMWLRHRPVVVHHLRSHAYSYVALAVAFAIVLACGTNLERVGFYTDFIAMLLWLSLLHGHVRQAWARRLSAAGCLLMLPVFVWACALRQENRRYWLYAEQQMTEPGRELIAVRMAPKGESWLTDALREHYVNTSIDFGFYCCYMAFDASDSNIRCAARLYGKQRLTFLPEGVLQRIATDTAAYSNCELDSSAKLFVWRLPDDRPVSQVLLLLSPEDVSQLDPLRRLLAYKGDSYDIDDFHRETVNVAGRPYLVFTRPTTNIFRRIRAVELRAAGGRRSCAPYTAE